MNLFTEIQDDILGDKPTSAILRKARILAFRLKNQELSDWVEFELNGYEDVVTLPDYRKIDSPILGDFLGATKRISNAPVLLDIFPQEWHEKFKMLESAINIGDGVIKIEADIDAAHNANKSELRASLPPSIFKYFSNRAYPNMVCLNAWKAISRQQLEQILETVRDRLQKFILELSDLYPDYTKVDFADSPSISQEKVNRLVQIVILKNSSFAGSINMTVEENTMTTFNQQHQKVIGDQLNTGGDINISKRIIAADLSDETKNLLAQLAKAVEEMNKSLSKEDAQQVTEDLNTFIEGAVSKKHSRKWWHVSVDGLKRAATKLGTMGKPVLELLAEIIPILQQTVHYKK